MKYSIKEIDGRYRLYRHDGYMGFPNNAELEFWLALQESRKVNEHIKAGFARFIKQIKLRESFMDAESIKWLNEAFILLDGV